MKVVLLFLVLVPLVFAANVYSNPEEQVEKRLSVFDIIKHIKDLDLGDNCVQACEDNVQKFWTFLCSAACKIILDTAGN